LPAGAITQIVVSYCGALDYRRMVRIDDGNRALCSDENKMRSLLSLTEMQLPVLVWT